ncbi:MAG: LytTR family DNA-binding domain-containing protein [Bacteroidetes bacterium]|nr:LytTR family DNA-binding domain-containing protein [Bacteroidota bacterium]
MKTKCIIVDDEPIAIKVIKNHLANFSDVEIVAECKNAMQAFDALKQKKIDLMFLDIQMPHITGLDFLKSLSAPPDVIITTAYRNFAVESYEFEVIDYLLKPIAIERFIKAMDRYFQKNRHEHVVSAQPAGITEDSFLYIRENKKMRKVPQQDILYIESFREYCKIHTTDGSIRTRTALSKVEEKLPEGQFLRIHKSFIVATRHIVSFNASGVWIGDTELPIGRSYKNSVQKILPLEEGRK